MKKKIVFIISVMLILTLSIVGLAACNPDNPPAEEKFTVSFDLNYPDAVGNVANQSVAKDAKATVPEAPARSNFVVRAWYREATLATPFDFAKETITEDITLYAGWDSTLYHVAGNFNGYVAKDDNFRMHEVVGKEGWFEITVDLTEENRDPTYDGHYYKVTNGTWDANGCWGADHYAVQPAPSSPTGGGLGSIYIYENRSLTINFDANEKVVYDNSMTRKLASPIIYGDFNEAMDRGTNWSTKSDEALALTDPDADGVFTGLFRVPAYVGEADGYSMAVAVSELYYIDQWGTRWGILDQYKFDGTPAGMAGVSFFKPTVEAIYEFKYDSVTHITTVTAVEAGEVQELTAPTIYGDFSNWNYEGSQPLVLTETDESGVFEGTLELDAYTGEGEGYMLAVGISKLLYDDEWGIRWGMNEQYKFDGTSAGMGGLSYLKPTVKTNYHFSYDSATHITTVSIIE